jgi:hypothetical protein
MTPKWASTRWKYIGVAVLFALCGAWSSQQFPERDRFVEPLFPLPFAGLCAVLFLRSPRAIPAVALSVPVYAVAHFVAIEAALFLGWTYFLPMCVAGFVGGAGLALSFGIGHRRLVSPRRLLRVATVGAVAAIPFGLWLRMYILRVNVPQDPLQPLRLLYSFAIWQAAVGTYLYAVCTEAQE